MTFSSPAFLFVFFPIVLLLYCLCPGLRAKNMLLMAASLLFYAYGEPFAMLLMLFVVFISWSCALLGAKNKQWKRFTLPIGIIGNLVLLGIYKYAGFFVRSFNDLCGTSLPIPQIVLPIGISFFIFQSISYLMDTAREQAQPQKNYLHLLLYISFFPQLIAGPIVRYQSVAEALNQRSMTLEQTAGGFRRMILGLSKKLLLADTLGFIADAAFNAGDTLTLPLAWLGAVCYTLQIYFDFSGYSDMAIGMGRIFGFSFPENFRYPYCADSITDFWRRWHISLTTWFREYLYIPLGGNRKGKWRTIGNKWIVFFCTGLWHGASWNFILWGLLNGFFMTLEQLLPKHKQRSILKRSLSHCYTMLVVICAFVLFRAETLTQAAQFYLSMFTAWHIDHAALSGCFHYLTPLVLIVLLLAILSATPLLRKNYATLRQQHPTIAAVCGSAATIILLLICMLNVASTSYHPFIYFRF